MTTMTLFDATPEEDVLDHQARIERARAERDVALDAVGAVDGWCAYAYEYLRRYLTAHQFLFTDDLWASDTNPDGLVPPPTTMRAFGPVVQRAAREGLIVKSGRYRPRTYGHLAEGPVWRSLLYVPPEGD